MPLTLEKQNLYRQRYARRTPGWRPATEVYESAIRQILKPGMRVLDIGCGRGGVLEQLSDAVSLPTGIDPDWLSLVEHRLPDLPRAAGIADALPFASSTFDMLLSSWVFEHLPEPAHTFKELTRVLKPGGYLLFLTPNKNSLIVWGNRLLKPLQNKLVPRLYGREEADTFPVTYQANSIRQLNRITAGVGVQKVTTYRIKDPTYLAFHPVLFHLNVWLSRLIPAAMAEHLIGIYQKYPEQNYKE